MVNGPGEAAQTEIGLTGGERRYLYIYCSVRKKVVNDEIISQVVKLVEDKINEKIIKYDAQRKKKR